MQCKDVPLITGHRRNWSLLLGRSKSSGNGQSFCSLALAARAASDEVNGPREFINRARGKTAAAVGVRAGGWAGLGWGRPQGLVTPAHLSRVRWPVRGASRHRGNAFRPLDNPPFCQASLASSVALSQGTAGHRTLGTRSARRTARRDLSIAKFTLRSLRKQK